jgi:hypothetical protein
MGIPSASITGSSQQPSDDDAAAFVQIQLQARMRTRASTKAKGMPKYFFYDAANMPPWLSPPWTQAGFKTGPLASAPQTSPTTESADFPGAPPQPILPFDTQSPGDMLPKQVQNPQVQAQASEEQLANLTPEQAAQVLQAQKAANAANAQSSQSVSSEMAFPTLLELGSYTVPGGTDFNPASSDPAPGPVIGMAAAKVVDQDRNLMETDDHTVRLSDAAAAMQNHYVHQAMYAKYGSPLE